MSIASACLPDRTVRVSVLAALAMHDIVTTRAPISHVIDRNPIMGRRVSGLTDRQRRPAGQLRSPLPAARHLLSAGRPGEPHERRALPLRALGGWALCLAG